MTPSSPTRRVNQRTLLAAPSPQPCELAQPHEPAEEYFPRPRKAIPASEQGYVMLIAIFFMALLVISLSVAAPKIARSIQRDRDLETFHRGLQYRRAVQLYYRKFHAYPPNVEALVNTNDIRFLRKKYKDPITGQDDWKPIAFGQNKTPTAMGFFGQPLAGNASTLAGIGPGGAGGLPGAATPGGGFSTGSPSSPGSIFGPSSDTGNGQSPSTGAPATTSTDNSGTPGSTSGGTSSTGAGTGGSSGPTGPTFGGAGIIGFSPASPNASILVYKKKQHYNEWEFTYDPLSDMQTVGGGNAGLVGQPASSTTTSVGAPTFGPSTNSPGSNPGSNPGSSSMPPETTPQ